MVRQQPANAASLPGIDHDESCFGPSRLEYDIATTADDHAAARLFRARNQRHVVSEIGFHEESAFPFGKMTLRHKEAALERLSAGLLERGKHVGLVLGTKRPDIDQSSVAKSLLAAVICGIRHLS